MDASETSRAAQLFVLLFSMAGPMKMIPVFAGLTAGAAPQEAGKLAIRVALLGLLGFALAIFVGVGIMTSWGVSREALAAGAGLVLLLSALLPMIKPPIAGPSAAGAEKRELPSAVSIAFPTMLAPNAMGIIILFAAFLPNQTLYLVGIGAALMTLNVLSMIFANKLFNLMGSGTLHILGAIFGILQLSLGVQMIFWAVSQSFI